MIIDPMLWSNIPLTIQYLFYQEGMLHLLVRRPILGKKGYILDRVKYDNKIDAHFIDNIDQLLTRVEQSSGYQFLIQRTDNFDGVVRTGDVIWAKDNEYIQVEKVTPSHIAGKNPRGITMDYHKSWIKSVNGVLYSPQVKATSGLLPEVHNQSPVNGEKALEILKGMV